MKALAVVSPGGCEWWEFRTRALSQRAEEGFNSTPLPIFLPKGLYTITSATVDGACPGLEHPNLPSKY